jgi:hypothetical protein
MCSDRGGELQNAVVAAESVRRQVAMHLVNWQ